MSTLSERIRAVLPIIAENVSLAESEAMVPAKNIALLQEAGFFKALQPERWGGDEIAIPEYVESIVLLAQSCASTAWVSGLLANHSHAIALFSEEVQREVWGENQQTLVSSSVAPLGKWSKVEDGIVLSGRFGWSSGCDHADWAVLGYMGENEMGQSSPCFALVPREDFTILEDWDFGALKGTGSKTIVVEEKFVPSYRCESLFALNFGLSRGFERNSGGLYFLPFSPVFSLAFSAVALGQSYKMIEVFKEKTRNRVRAYTGAKVAESTPAYMRLAESLNQTTAAHQLLIKDWSEMQQVVEDKAMPSPEEILDWRVHQSYSTKMSIESVDRLFSAAGGGAWHNNNEMQRLFRDVHICGSHAQTDFDVAAQTYGRHLLELPSDSKLY